MRTSLVAAFLIASFVPAARSAVLVVDDSGGTGVTHLDIGAAVAAAVDGDLILVRSGSYAEFVVDGKAISIVADAAAVVSIANSVTIQNLAVSQTVLLRGVSVIAPAKNSYTVQEIPKIQGCIRLSQVDGHAVIEDCHLFGSLACVRATAAHAQLERVDAKAGPAYMFAFAAQQPGVGLDAQGSVITIDRSILVGGDGYNDNIGNGDGGAGARFANSDAYAVGSEIAGGTGNAAANIGAGLCLHGGDGGTGIVATGAASIVRIAATNAHGGAGGAPSAPAPIPCPGGASGVASVVTGGAQLVDTVLATPRGVTADGPTRVGQTVTLTFQGAVGDAVLLFWGATPEQAAFPIYDHSLLATPNAIVLLGTLSAGTWAVPATMSPIVGGGLSHVVYAQAAMIDATGDVVLGGASTIIALDPSL